MCEEIARLARQLSGLPQPQARERLDCAIDRALTHGEWDELAKWHRVRLRLKRMEQTRTMAQQLGCGVV